MRSRPSYVVILGALGMTACSLTARDPEPMARNSPGDFADHSQQVDDGRIDWTNGYILADGIGHPNGRETSDGQRKNMATRAAEIVAARNALAITLGVRLDPSRKVADLANGQIQVQGVVRGHRVVQSHWNPNANPPTARVRLQVPLWGVSGVASVLVDSGRSRAQQTADGKRVALSDVVVDVSDVLIVIDARGRKIPPCLFPAVVDADGRTLYDVCTLSPETASRGPTARYVETRLSYEQLRSAAGSRFTPVWFDVLAQDSPGAARANGAPATSPTAQPPAATQASHRRAKQRIVVKATDATGAQNPQLVITREDAERLRTSPQASGAMRKAQVVVVVDASAAGSEGRAPFETDDAVAILTEP